MHKHPLITLQIFFLLVGLTACQSGPQTFEDPVAAMMDQLESPSTRLRAADQAKQQNPTDPKRLAALHQLVWERGHPHQMRAYAIDQLIAHDEVAFRKKLHRRIVLVQNWKTLDYLFKTAIKHGWGKEFTPTLIRQYARFVHGMREEQRPERKVIQDLYPDKTVEQVVFESFLQAGEQGQVKREKETWDLLARICSTSQLIAFLEKAPAKTTLVANLQTASRDLGVLPTNKEGMLWLAYWRDPVRKAWWSAVKQCVAVLSPEQRQGLQMRHLPVLAALTESQLNQSRAQWIASITASLKTTKHYLTGPQFDGPMRDYPQRFTQGAKDLHWADLATIQLVIQALKEPQIVAALFAQADEDHRDRGTEYGGVLRHADIGFKIKLYKPRIRKHDLKFYPTEAMYRDLYTGIAHYHFHAQHIRNADYAGPGLGDMKFSKRNHFACLVFTFLDANRMNVDYYQNGKTIVDIGVIHR